MKGIKAFLLSSLMILLYCCNSHNFVDSSHPVDKQNLKFSASIDNDSLATSDNDGLATRKQDNSWEKGDVIGLFSFESGKPYHEGTVDSELLNRKFIYNESGFFTPSEGQVSYPTTKRDLFAYYPYQDQTDLVKDFTYVVNIADQSDIDQIDLLYSNNLKDFEVGIRPKLQFIHVLPRFNLNVISKEYDLAAAEVKLIGLQTKADFNLLSGKIYVNEKVISEVPITAQSTNSSLSFSALVLPTQQPQDIKVVITLKDGTPFTWKVPSAWTWESGKKYTKTIRFSPEGTVTPDPTPSARPGFFEIPQSSSKIPNTVFITHYVPKNSSANIRTDKNGNRQRNYSLLYDEKYKIAYWVAFPHHKNFMGKAKRTNKWAFDPKVNTSLQVNAIRNAYQEKYSRGHQIASSDRNADEPLNETTFYMTNITPQLQDGLNGGIWMHLENHIKDHLRVYGDTVWVVTGAGLAKDSSLIKYANSKVAGGGKAAIPTYYYKALAKKVGNKYYTIGYKMDHRAYKGSIDQCKVTVKELEDLTGFTFFDKIPEEEKAKIVDSQWKNE